MKKIAVLLVATAFCATAFSQGKQLSALFDYAVFNRPESNQPYVETHLDIDAGTLQFAADESGQYRATVEVTLVVRSADTIAYLKKYDLHSPYTASADATGFTFFDLQRFALGLGIYDLELTLRDKNQDGQSYTFTDKLVVYYPKDKPVISDLLFVKSASRTTQTTILSRNGYDIVPRTDAFFPADISRLSVYFEIYNLDKEVSVSKYSVCLYAVQKETGRRVAGIERTLQKSKARSSEPVLTDIDIEALPSGNYLLVVEVRDAQNETMLKKEVPFMRSNPAAVNDRETEAAVAASFAGLITDEQKLDYYLDALYPISSDPERDVAKDLIRHPGSVSAKQTYLYQFWTTRSPLDAAGKWKEYLGWLTYVDEHYSYPRTPGYRTDRGRVYLQYGPPDFIRDEKNFVGALRLGSGTSAQQEFAASQTAGVDATTPRSASQGHIYYLPYQIWRYNHIETDEPNRVFLFWDEFRSGFYKLLNSNARGEVRDPKWERRLCQQQLDEDVVGEVGEQFARGY